MSGEQTYKSGDIGTTGREVFEHSTGAGPGPGYGKDHGESATSGFEGSTGIGAGGSEHHHHHQSGGPPAVTGSAGNELVGGAAGSYGKEVEGADPHANTGAALPGTAGTGGGVPPAGDAYGQASYQTGRTGIGGTDKSQIGDSYGANTSGLGAGGITDRVGALNQDGALYERTTDQGPVTGGAAGTERFNTDKGYDRTGVTGNSYGAQDAYPNFQEETKRGQGKSSGGLQGVFATSDKDFTGRDRLGSGAYADTDGRFQNNTTGPDGNTALTGREGTLEKNPVAQAKSRETGQEAGVEDENGEASKGFVQKIKDALT